MRLGLLMLGALALSTLMGGPAMARNNRPPATSAKCWVTPNPVSNDVAGQQFWVNGSGFQPGVQLSIFVGTGTIEMAVTDASGSFSVWDWAPGLADGDNVVHVYRAGDRHMTVLATCGVLVL